VRALEPASNYLNDQVYQLGDLALMPFNDHYQRLLLESSVQFRNANLRRDH